MHAIFYYFNLCNNKSTCHAKCIVVNERTLFIPLPIFGK